MSYIHEADLWHSLGARASGLTHPETQAEHDKARRSWLLDRTPEYSSCGLVYFIRDPVSGLLKIGKTRNLGRRIQELQFACDGALRLEHFLFCENPDFVEKALHSIFERQRVQGEWFALPEVPPWLAGVCCVIQQGSMQAPRAASFDAALNRSALHG